MYFLSTLLKTRGQVVLICSEFGVGSAEKNTIGELLMTFVLAQFKFWHEQFMMYSYVHHDKHARQYHDVCHDILPQNVSAMYMAWELWCYYSHFSL